MKHVHLVREMKKHGPIRVANAIYSAGYIWIGPRPRTVEGMTMGLPRVKLVQILNELRGAK